MLKQSDFSDPFEPIYTFVDHAGVNTHIASARLRAWCLEHRGELEPLLAPIEEHLLEQFLREHTVSKLHCEELLNGILPLDMADWEPIIFVHDGTYGDNGGPNVMLVDGHHRYMCAGIVRSPTILAWFLTEAQWREFQIEDHKDMTQQQLRELPIIKVVERSPCR